MPTYATTAELNTHLGYTPAGAQGLLDRASRDVERAIKCATYATGEDDLPTDGVVLAALKAATLEQVAYQLEIGNSDGIAHGMQSGVPSGTSAGGVDLSRGRSVGGRTDDLPYLSSQAWWELQRAGLTAQGPATYLGGG